MRSDGALHVLEFQLLDFLCRQPRHIHDHCFIHTLCQHLSGFALQLLYHKNGGGGMSRVTKALKNMPEAMTLIHGYCI